MWLDAEGERWEMKPGRWAELDPQDLDDQLNSLDLRTRLRNRFKQRFDWRNFIQIACFS